jgi:ATP phosphoribosyltransferase regulatory subunit
VQDFVVDLADARIVDTLLAGTTLDAAALTQLHAALATKDASAVRALSGVLGTATRDALLALLNLYGDIKVLDEAARVLPDSPPLRTALDSLRFMAGHLAGHTVTFDLADLRGYAYYTGSRFSVFAAGASDALVRGGRYDEVGAVFGRNRPAVGFSLDLKEMVALARPRPVWPAIRAPWRDDAALRHAIAALRAQGEIVVCVLPGHDSEVEEFQCDRQLLEVADQWVVSAI